MPIIVPISEILKLDKDDAIPMVHGIIKSVFEQNTGEKNGKAWAFQKLIIADAKQTRTTIAVKVWDKDPLPESLQGKPVWIYGEKGKGVYADQDTYKGKTNTIIKVTKAGTISITDPSDDGSGAPEKLPDDRTPAERSGNAPANQPSQTAGAGTTPAAKTKEFHQMDDVDKIIMLRRTLARKGNAFRMTAEESLRTIGLFAKAHGLQWDAAAQMATIQNIAEKMTDTSFTTLYLSLGDYVVDAMPIGDIDDLLHRAKERVEERKAAKAAKQGKE